MIYLQKQWRRVVDVSSEVDLTFLLLRVFSLLGGIVWLLIAPFPHGERAILVKALIYFSMYSFFCYLVIFFRPGLMKKVYLASLFLDMVFLSNLVHSQTNFGSSFYLGFYLLICLHTIYFGLAFGLMVAFFSAVCYGISISPMIQHIEWTDLAMRIGFLFFIAVPVGMLTEKVKRDKDKVENFNKTLENTVEQRTKKIGSLLDQERYLREILATVAHINQLLITESNMVGLLESSCARFVQHGHYGFCWIGLLTDDTIQTVHTSDTLGTSLLDPPYTVYDEGDIFFRSSTAQCIRENRTIISENSIEEPEKTPWRNPEDGKGFHAVISLPLRAHKSSAPLGALTIFTLRKEGFEPEEQEMLDELAGDIGFAIDSFRQKKAVTKLIAERTANYEETIFSFVDMIEQRDTYTAGHTERVAHYCQVIAREMGIERAQREKLYKAAILHDIGKVATPDSVLLKPGKLTSLDYDLIKLHSLAGYEMLSKVEMYKELAEIILHHHERYDGKGYPNGLKGDEIPLFSRIMAVGDAFDAMTTNRIYKPRKDISEALVEIKSLSGTQFYPEAVNAAMKVLANIKPVISVNQLPLTNLEKKRFSYFFNDMLTGLYNEDYLKTILNNLDLNHYTCLHMLHLMNVPEYNKRHGWAKGDEFFKSFAAELQVRFPETLIFRAYGNDFAFISKEHLAVDSEVFNGFACVNDTEIEVEVHHIDLAAGTEYTIDKLEKLEILALDASH